jgi:hypothetical protein
MVEARINDPSTVDRAVVLAILDRGMTPTIQFSRPGYTPALLEQVNQLCVEFGDRIEVRFYGHYDDGFDASALESLRDVRWLTIDCLMSVANNRWIDDLPPLTRFSFGVHDFDDPALLEKLNLARLTHLRLSENAKRNLDLAPLAGAARLEQLSVQGHSRNVEVIAGLPALHTVGLSGFPNKKALGFLNALAPLRCLRLILGSRTSIGEFRHPDLEVLEIVRVRGLEDVSALARFPRLRALKIEDQVQLRSIDVAGAPLRSLWVLNCKNLESIDGLASLHDLVECRLGRTKLDLESLAEADWPKSLEVLALYTDSQTWNARTREALDQRGFREFGFR